jgi:hypothetical protein
LVVEENIVLFEADSAEQAGGRAAEHGGAHEGSYTAASGVEIRWVYDSLYSVFEIGERPASGTEVYSRFLRASEVTSLLTPFE